MDESESHVEGNPHPAEPVNHLAEQFDKPLESAGVDRAELRKEFMQMLEHSTNFISLSILSYCEGGGDYSMHLVHQSG